MPISYVPSTTTSPIERLVASDDALMADDVAGRVDRWMAAVDRPLGVGERSQHLVLDDDRLQCPPARLGVVGSDRGDRLADVAHDVAGEDRLIAADQSVRRLAGHIVGSDDRRDAVDAPRRRDVDAHDPRVRMRRAQCRAPQEPVCREVARERERALHLGDAVGTRRAVAQPTARSSPTASRVVTVLVLIADRRPSRRRPAAPLR